MSGNPRALGPVPLSVLLAMYRLGCVATAAEIAAEARCTDEVAQATAKMALGALVNRELAEAGSFGGNKYGYRLTGLGADWARKAALCHPDR